MEPTDLTGKLREQLERERGLIACAYLYGSRATGQARDDSDVDLAVLFRDPQEPALVCPAARLAQRLEQAIRSPIDLVDIEQAPVDLVHRILRDGILLLDAIPERRIAFEVDARNRYFDLLPYLQEYRRSSAA
ncbi:MULTISPECIES: type VII toxin-antitoxin system MntA family adenylyltransferase antitoxin [unclassified Halorhodospira]|uniref:type VII toxin-antitoxin system MntA family adenylyltransferase antitoxin n=1 Tax=unclassified Halorhodospira TaxID=2626748 RepID=UPI001EE7C96E|nr:MULTISPECIES: nucleotidyltransferase domain-containing protein [unclassified Halorhodospira]MCG5542063.1 nucleotidyltransferase domain-containing protein [Halorhodospira sp. M39old]MCG5547114.1 nucleotidyltransferase domain-containing protein [Halorhodospira sp. M38]